MPRASVVPSSKGSAVRPRAVPDKHGHVTVEITNWYNPKFSAPELGIFVWTYKVVISNYTGETIRLARREWHIFDGDKEEYTRFGDAVGGKPVYIKKNKLYTYESCVSFDNKYGFMYGSIFWNYKNNSDKNLYYSKTNYNFFIPNECGYWRHESVIEPDISTYKLSSDGAKLIAGIISDYNNSIREKGSGILTTNSYQSSLLSLEDRTKFENFLKKNYICKRTSGEIDLRALDDSLPLTTFDDMYITLDGSSPYIEVRFGELKEGVISAVFTAQDASSLANMDSQGGHRRNSTVYIGMSKELRDVIDEQNKNLLSEIDEVNQKLATTKAELESAKNRIAILEDQNAAMAEQLADPRRGIAEFCRSYLLPEELWPKAVTEITYVIQKILINKDRRLWDDRAQYPELAKLSAPEFLKRVWSDHIGADGTIEKEIVRQRDSSLMAKVDSYLSMRRSRNQDTGDAKGLNFIARRSGRKPPQLG